MTTSSIEELEQKVEKNKDSVTESDLDELQQAALSGNYEAAYVLAGFYVQGNKDIHYNYELNLKWLIFSAENGYPPAMFMLYNIYSGKYNGLGNMPNAPEKAWEWLNKSFDAGFVLAKRELGNCYRKGVIVDKDSEKAYAYYYDAMEDGDISSIISLAEMFEDGDGVDKSDTAAFTLYEIAAKAKDAYSQSILGDKYYHGIGTEKNLQLAYEW